MSSLRTMNLLLSVPFILVQRDDALFKSSLVSKWRKPNIASTNDRNLVPLSLPPTLSNGRAVNEVTEQTASGS